MKLQNYLWTLPFLSFLAGYLVLQQFSRVEKLEAPNIVGRQLQEAVAELSAHNLNIRFIAQKNDPDLPEGTILSQTPAAGQQIKPHQAIHVLISKSPHKIAAPLLVGKPEQVIKQQLSALGIRSTFHRLASNRPFNTCIAQLPTAGTQLEKDKVTVYLSAGSKKPILLPDLKGKTVPKVAEFLQRYNVQMELVHTKPENQDHQCDQNCVITDQRPLAGSIVILSEEKPLVLHLQVSG